MHHLSVIFIIINYISNKLMMLCFGCDGLEINIGSHISIFVALMLYIHGNKFTIISHAIY